MNLEVLDREGAIREMAKDAGATRGDILKRAGIATAGFVAAGAMFESLLSPAAAAISTSKKSAKNDVKILNYALTLEFLEAEFYAAAKAANIVKTPDVLKFLDTVADHEAKHVTLLKSVLGKAAVKKPTFDFSAALGDEKTFMQTAQLLEDTGVAAYAGQGPNISQKAVVVAALGIHSVEARHAGWIRFLNMTSPAPGITDPPKRESTVLSAVADTGFIQS
ncbi:ferritin-like domain-containing protein [Solirubrobacter phytolaccae]|uniref:Ferritin-like domain-containing protein n=1 Tax=Solirubrobacter phytolaccae TaxID=1404360 RepID=A0A9X3N3U5_9ACTN|nr:ferritin-like domain-containing protein [Solirubrobacter phytolaccae]MDA0178966.1 ferritin-like domain-containing protein [Solirubrobacter phytolaccae]